MCSRKRGEGTDGAELQGMQIYLGNLQQLQSCMVQAQRGEATGSKIFLFDCEHLL